MASTHARLLWSPLMVLTVVSGLLFTLTSCQCQQNSLRPEASPSAAPAEEKPRLSRLQQQDQPIQLVQNLVPPPPPPSSPAGGTVTPPPAPTSPREDPGFNVSVAAWVNGRPVYREELLNEAAARLFNIDKLPDSAQAAERQKILKSELQKLIEREVVLQDAYTKLSKHKVFMEKLRDHAGKTFDRWARQNIAATGLNEIQFWEIKRRQGWTKDSIRRKFERELIYTQYLNSRVGDLPSQVGHAEMREYYETHLNEFQIVDRVKWQDIFIAVGPKHPNLDAVRQAAREILERCAGGEDFARFLHLDEGVGAANKGFGIGELRGQIQPAQIEAYIWEMRDGMVGPPVEISTGIHLFRLVKREYAGQLGFTEDVQNQIRNKLRNEIFEREAKRIVRDLVSRAVIEHDAEALR